MAPNVDPEEHSIQTTADPEPKLFSRPHLSRVLSDGRGALLEEEHLLLSGELPAKTRSPRWVIDSSSRLHTFTRVYLVCLHLIIAILIAVVLVRSHIPGSIKSNSNGSWSPAKDHVQHRISSYWPSKHGALSVYGGKPTVDQDAAWDNMLSPMYFAASREEVLKAGETIVGQMVEVNTGGYLATLGVYHELHCIRQLRLYLYQERYYHNLTEKQQAYSRLHLDHCLEVLRITIMCNGNTDMFTFVSQSLTPGKPTIKSNARSVCVDWGSLERWTQLRKLNETQHAVMPDIWNKTATGTH